MYQIADLEQLTGIKAHTIRIWEKRYSLIEPHRSNTNIRYYDEVQAKMLLNIASLISAGIKISKVAELGKEGIEQEVEKLKQDKSADKISVGYINDLTTAMMQYDELTFEKSFNSALNRMGVYQTMIDVIYPFLFNTGLMWRTNKAMPSQEHFATTIIRRKLMSAIDGINLVSKKPNKVILFLPENEWHDIGLLFSEYILRSHQINVINLGQNVPYDNVAEVLKACKSKTALTFFVTRKSAEEFKSAFTILYKGNKDLQLLAGVSEINKNNTPKNKNFTVLSSPNQMKEYFGLK